MVAGSSSSTSSVNGNPVVSKTKVFRPGIGPKRFAKSRIASSNERAANCGSELPGPKTNALAATTSDGGVSGFGEIPPPFTPCTALFNRSASTVKFCTTRIVPPKSITAMARSGPAFASINFTAAFRPIICDEKSNVESSNSNTM